MTKDSHVSASYAARMLGVSRQRVSTMVREGDLPAVRPWGRALLIPRDAIEAWKRGERPPSISTMAVRKFVLDASEADALDSIGPARMNSLCRSFIAQARPNWTRDEQHKWAEAVSARLVGR